jgi:IclR family transcriptional regulator, KDG regulon repressor
MSSQNIQASSERASAQTVTLALDLLEIISRNPSSTLSKLSREAGYSLNRTFRLLNALEQAGYVVKDRHKTYHLGARLLVLGRRTLQQNPLLQAANSIMDELSARTKETISLAVRVGTTRSIVANRESKHPLKLSINVEDNIPLYWGALGCCLLAFAPNKIQKSVLTGKFKAYSAQTITDPIQLAAHLEKIRTTHLDVIHETSLGVFSIAAPIFEQPNQAIAAIAIGGALVRLDAAKQEMYSRLIQETALTIATRLRQMQ